jgi:hypothetical protein
MTPENCGEPSSPIREFAFIVFRETIQTTKPAKTSFAAANTGALRYMFSTKWADIAFPEFEQVLFF